MSKSQDLLEEVIRKHRTLSLHGFRHKDYAKETGNDFLQDREGMVKYSKPFSHCLRFLKRVRKQQDFNFEFSTYALKHFVEEIAMKKGPRVYVQEGIFIAAAYASGFKVRRVGGKVFLNTQLDHGPKGCGIYSGKSKLLSN